MSACVKCGNPGHGFHLCLDPDKPLQLTQPVDEKPKRVYPEGRSRTPYKPVAELTPEQLERRRASGREAKRRERNGEALVRTCFVDECPEVVQRLNGRCAEHRRQYNNAIRRKS